MEEWHVIDSNPDYQVSNTGLVRSIKFNRVKVLRPVIRSGYWRVQLTTNGIGISCSVNRLVAAAFIPNPDNKEQVDHINRIKTDNRAENLRWATRSENCVNKPHSAEHRNISQRNGSYRVYITRNQQIVFLKTYSTLAEAITARDTFINGC